MLYHEDCLTALKRIPDTSIDLVYLDPPFFTQRDQKMRDSNGKQYKFSDTWNSRDEYLNYMRIRLVEIKRVLKDTGNIFLHCDATVGYFLRMVLDDIFGAYNFQSEIIWSYKRWSNSRKGLLPCHQTILYYSKTSNYKFNTIYGSYSPTTNIDQILQERERNDEGKVVYKRDENGEIVAAKRKKGVPISDVWEIPFLNPKAKERTGYPTQKPIELLDRIIQIGSDCGDTVLDPFCGSGTTLVSAKLLGRNYIGIDVNQEAIALTRKRLDMPIKTTSCLLRVGTSAYETKTEDELAILNQFPCNVVQRNRGIDAFLKKHY
jgi:site-specific DNA-methyltransferase (adenine-specific)